MSKEAEKLRERKIFNNYEIAKLGDKVWCEYYPSSITSICGWRVHAIGKRLSSAWYDYGARNFIGNKNDTIAFNLAIRLCSRLTGQSEWVLSPFGGFVSIVTALKVGFKITKRVKLS